MCPSINLNYSILKSINLFCKNMAKIESTKSYEGRDLETIFFRPMLSGPNAVDLGIKVMYNMPFQRLSNSGNVAVTSCRNTPLPDGTAVRAPRSTKSLFNSRRSRQRSAIRPKTILTWFSNKSLLGRTINLDDLSWNGTRSR